MHGENSRDKMVEIRRRSLSSRFFLLEGSSKHNLTGFALGILEEKNREWLGVNLRESGQIIDPKHWLTIYVIKGCLWRVLLIQCSIQTIYYYK